MEKIVTIKGIDEELWKELRIRALRAHITMGELLNDILRKGLQTKEE